MYNMQGEARLLLASKTKQPFHPPFYNPPVYIIPLIHSCSPLKLLKSKIFFLFVLQLFQITAVPKMFLR